MMKQKENIKRCVRCALPETYPGIKFNNVYKCNYCTYYDIYKEREEVIKKILKKEFIKLIYETKQEKHKYDCIVAYSGGKDSTFLLYFLQKKFGLNILAHTLDNGFISEKALQNIREITKTLNIDHKFTRPPFNLCKEIFSYALEGKFPYPKEILAMVSPLCATCIGMVFGTTIKLAIKFKIPLMFVGFTPGQYPAVSLENFLKVKSCVFLSEKVYKDDPMDVLKIIRDPLNEKFGEKIEKYYFKSQYIQKDLRVPKILFPFHALLDYDENKILEEISKLGWEKPKDTDPCSTNCLVNTIGNYACVKQLRYHPYIGEMSLLVRNGKISYKDALKAEMFEVDSFAMKHSLRKIGLAKSDL